MAKRKRAAHEKPFSRPMPKMETDGAVAVAQQEDTAPDAEQSVGNQFVGKWNQLVSTTNWDKGQIICAWREALIDADAPVTDYSDEAWAQLVGGVTSQHVGRLRRVYERFGKVTDQYDGLFWSHFQACLDWDDAEMWLEGSIQNKWSVSQMRGKRWETLGTPPDEQDVEVAELQAEQTAEAAVEADSITAPGEPASAGGDAPSDSAPWEETSADGSSREDASEGSSSSERSALDSKAAEPVEKRTRLNVDVDSLPADVAEAFESFKLAIIAHRRDNWRDTTQESVVECLESLKQLTLADAE